MKVFVLLFLLWVPLSSSNYSAFKTVGEMAGDGTVYEIHPSCNNYQYIILNNSKGLYHIEVNAASSNIVSSKTLIFFK